MTVRLSAAMIVRDEAAMLGDCLRSLQGLADEVVVVDTGSSDGTRALAAGLGARVVEFPWTGAFATARNEALRHARGRWILYVDADERVHAVGPDQLDALLADDAVVAYTVRFRPRAGFTRYREYRIFRNDPRIRFRGVIHESMLAGIQEVAARDGLRIAPSDVAIDHLGYDGAQAHKHRRDVPLLRARLADDPHHVYSWTHLGHALAGLGDEAGALAAWRRAVELVRGLSATVAHDSLPYLALLHREIERGGDPGPLLVEATRRFPDHHGLAWLRGRALMVQGRYAEAIPAFAALADIDPETFIDPGIAYDGRIFGEGASASLALCCFRLGRYAESARHYARAKALAPGDPGHRVRRLLAQARARREAEAAATGETPAVGNGRGSRLPA